MYDPNALYHHGILGQKWGVRHDRKSSGKRHIGIDEHGNLNLIRGKSSTSAYKKFAIKTSISVGLIAASVYLAKHPRAIQKGKNYVGSVGSDRIYSKKLGRELTPDEAEKFVDEILKKNAENLSKHGY